MKASGYQRHLPGPVFSAGRSVVWMLACVALARMMMAQPAAAQTVTTLTVSDAVPGGAIADLSCNLALTSQLRRNFNVGTSFIVGDVDLGILLTHTYRSDLQIFLTSPAGTTVNLYNLPGNVQSGDNMNDLFDDEAAAAASTHNATVTDPTTAPYSHSFRPTSPLSAFDGQNALGTWTVRICDAVASDTGNFLRADLYLTSTRLSVAKTSVIISDPISGTTNPKAIPGAVLQYCILMTNNGRTAAPNATVPQTGITATDRLPTGESFIAGSAFSGTTCATAASTAGISVTGSTITATTASLAPDATFALVFRATII